MTAAIAVLEASVGEPQAFTPADIAFHDAIIRATKNHLLPRLFDLLRPLIEFGREISVSARPHGPTVSQQGHLAVFEAIRAGSPTEARRAMEDHLSWTANLDFGERSVRLALDDARRDPAAAPAAEDAPTPADTGD